MAGTGRPLALFIIMLFVLAAMPVRAAGPMPGMPVTPPATTAAPSPPADPAEVPAFVGRLDDRQARALLLDTLARREAPAAAAARPASVRDLFERVRQALADAGGRVGTLVASLSDLGPAFAAIMVAHGFDAGSLPQLIWQCGLALGLAGAAEALTRIVAARLAGPRQPASGPVLRNGRRIAVRLAGLAVFSTVAVATVSLASDAVDVQQALAFSLVGGAILARIADTVAYLSIAFLLPVGPGARKGIVRKALRTVIVALHTVAIGAAILLAEMEAAGSGPEAPLLVGIVAWIAFGILLPVGISRLARIAARPDRETGLAHEGVVFRWLAMRWRPILTVVVAVLWLVTGIAALRTGTRALAAGLCSLLILAYAPAAIRLATLGLRRLFAQRPTEGAPQTAPWATALVRSTRMVGTAMAVYALGLAWDVDVFALANDRFGQGVVRATMDVALIVLAAYLAWEFVKALLRTERDGQTVVAPAGEDGFIQPASRMETFLPLVEKFLLVVVMLVAGMAILRRLGVDTAPLLAGAGIAGIAIGFGAQTLVKDIVSGVFFLLDDAFRLGEYVEIDQTRGTVEGISIRSLRIRHHRGAIHTVPFGTIQRLTNYSRDWIILKLEFLLAFDTDLRKVKKIVKEIGKELIEDPEHGPHFLEPVKSQGVRRMEQIGMVIGIKFMAKPGEQFVLRREVYQRVRDAFERNGIAFARPQVVVQMPAGNLTPEEAETVAAAAAEAAGEPPPPPAEARSKRGG